MILDAFFIVGFFHIVGPGGMHAYGGIITGALMGIIVGMPKVPVFGDHGFYLSFTNGDNGFELFGAVVEALRGFWGRERSSLPGRFCG